MLSKTDLDVYKLVIGDTYSYFFEYVEGHDDYEDYILPNGIPDLKKIKELHHMFELEYQYYLDSLARMMPSGPEPDWKYYDIFNRWFTSQQKTSANQDPSC